MSTPYSKGLRQLANFADKHPELFANAYGHTFDIFAHDRAHFAKMARELGTAEKAEMASWYMLRKHFGPHKLELNIQRDLVCEKVQIGTEIVSTPDPEKVALVPTIEVEVPVYKWNCPESILKP